MSLISFSEFKQKYCFQGILGRGTFGKVCMIKEVKTSKMMALKKMTVKSKRNSIIAENEVNFLNLFQHPSVI